MSRAITVPMTPDLMTRIGHLRAQLIKGDVPPEIRYVKARLAAAVANAERLQILFGGHIDQGSVDEAVFWKMELDGAYLRATHAA